MGFCCIRAEVDDFVFFVEGAVGVGEGDGVEGGEDEVGGVVYEMFCYLVQVTYVSGVGGDVDMLSLHVCTETYTTF